MESGFTDFVLDELRQLISEIENVQEPSNVVLDETVKRELRIQYDRQQRRFGK